VARKEFTESGAVGYGCNFDLEFFAEIKSLTFEPADTKSPRSPISFEYSFCNPFF
jgi:hypothetical protein